MKEKKFSLLLFLNGQPYVLETYKIPNLDELIFYFSYKLNLIVVECNGKIASKNFSTLKKLEANDQIETITVVGGG